MRARAFSFSWRPFRIKRADRERESASAAYHPTTFPEVLIRVEALHSRDLSVWMIASSLVRSACSPGSLDRVLFNSMLLQLLTLTD
ncbi:hypothetical protein NDU88_007859 [Pleurodeles waltl]|uniref:Uncharacterized protein n=1 Tax=Pleurodeles waltl TaxID=8319 RepID=A0AAV7N828_PLEWA|nr:hypothetical protein NDU88_007859 [Pleurodeles waltl]